MVIGISGKIRAGKSKVAKDLSEILRKRGKQVEQKSFAFPIYKILSEMYETSIDKIKDEKQAKVPIYINTRTTESGFVMSDFRKLLQLIGNGLREYGDSDVWVDVLFGCNNTKIISDLTGNADVVWVIEDLRYPNEAQRIRDLNGMLIRVERNEHQPNSHVAENSLDDWTDWDVIIDNNFNKDEYEVRLRKLLEDQDYERFFRQSN